ncbi:hypothetical protein V144x_03290 [Gimesia aquarii]|uniref:Uncharacterized protein n=1 Tax=Gimesia aquarii TaxID=2527964 RepID=A0A517VPF0_9PLAN|nr:hypothetical protein V144x_03290 [Gimesia aquarii]
MKILLNNKDKVFTALFLLNLMLTENTKNCY